MRRASFLFILLWAASSAVAAADLVLTEDATWSGEVTVDGRLEVGPGAVLTIAAGTDILFRDGASLYVRGRLVAAGTADENIRFTRHPEARDWERILFVAADESLLRHCIIEYSDCEGDHKDYYDDRDADCAPVAGERPPRDYFQAVVAVASNLELDACTFRNLPGDGRNEGDAIAIISDDPVHPGDSTAVIRGCKFLSIGQGIHTRYSYVLVEDCFFTDHHGDNDDVDLFGESDPPPLIRNNLFLDPAHDDMINPTRCSAIIEGNVIDGSDDHGIVLRDRCDPIVVNNIVTRCSSAGISVQNTCDALLINNTIYDCRRGVRFFDHTGRWGRPYCLEPGSGSATLVNCVIWDCPTPLDLENSPSDDDPGSHVTVSHCDIQGGRSRLSVSSDSTVDWREGNIDADPLFVDARGGDFAPRPDSPLVDSGTATDAPEVDLHGRPRPCGDAVDVGALESGDCAALPRFLRADANADGTVDVSDGIAILLYLFAGAAAPPCETSADADDDGRLDATDAVFTLNFLFQGGASPPPPGAVDCGLDPTEDGLSCAEFEACSR